MHPAQEVVEAIAGFYALKPDVIVQATSSAHWQILNQAGDAFMTLGLLAALPDGAHTIDQMHHLRSVATINAFCAEFLGLPLSSTSTLPVFRVATSLAANDGKLERPFMIRADAAGIMRLRIAMSTIANWAMGGRAEASLHPEVIKINCAEKARSAAARQDADRASCEAAALSIEEFNAFHKRAIADHRTSRYPRARLPFATRQGNEKDVLAHICCGAVHPRACRCTPSPERDSGELLEPDSLASLNKTSSLFTGSLNAPSGAAVRAAADERRLDRIDRTKAVRIHPGDLVSSRTTKTQAAKCPTIAHWSCCGTVCAEVDSTPNGFSVTAERDNGCVLLEPHR